MNVDQKLWRPNPAIGILGAVLLCGSLGCADDEGRPSAATPADGAESGSESQRHEYIGPIVQRPPIVPADAVKLDPSAQVIGVMVKGHCRAYRTLGMKKWPRHVVNDVIERVPVTVTYCDLMESVRAFTKPVSSDEPLSIRVCGFDDKQGMLLEIDGDVVPQEAKTVPLDRLEFELTTWGAWKAAHPDTDLCFGE